LSRNNKTGILYRTICRTSDKMSEQHHWSLLEENNVYRVYTRDGCTMKVFLIALSVETTLQHPIKGETKLKRSKITLSELENIFKNPRAHTGKGKYKQE
jgi:hypothetical protein